MLKMAVFGPMPNATAMMTAVENPGALFITRTADLRSDEKTLMRSPL